MVTFHVDLGTEWRGGQAQALLLMKGLRARGHVAELVSPRGSPLSMRSEAEGIRVHPVAHTFARPSAALKLDQLLSEKRAEIVHTHEAHALTVAWLARAHQKAGLVASRRLAYRLHQNYVSLARYRAAARVVAVSKFVAESVVASGIEGRRVTVIYDGVETRPMVAQGERKRARQRWGIGDDGRLLGCVGYLLPEKDQELLIRALPLLRREFSNCRLLLAGDGPSRPHLEALANQSRVANAVIFAGFVENVTEVYAALDAFLFPSLAEPLGSSMLAAMAFGLPTVARARGAVPEVITDGENGLLVEGPGTAAFASAVTRILSEPGLGARLGAAARETVERRFSADRMVEETLRIYEGICQAPSGAPRHRA